MNDPCFYFLWYIRQPVWLRVLLFPILVPVMFVHGVIVVSALFLFVLPYYSVLGCIEYRRFWKKLRERGQVGSWPEVKPQIASGSGTLIVEVTPKGPGCSWLIDLPRDVVDPEHVLLSWQQFEEQGWEALEATPTSFDAMNGWTVERLGAYESSARALTPSWTQLAKLQVETKQQSVLAVPCWCDGCLTKRYQR
jgi:hypothetical protein